MIDVTDVTKKYVTGDIEFLALKGLTFSVKEGEFVAIMGPSGSGKSTLMHILGALDVPSTGTYMLDGKDVSKMEENELAVVRREKIGYVFQSFNLLKRTSVLRNVMIPLMYAGVPRAKRLERATRALHSAGLDETYFNHLSNQISGGQMQRVAIARALVNEPAIILADEPTGNLDSKTGNVVLGTFQRLNKEGHTIVLITHERDVAEHAQRIITIRDGMVQKEETNFTQRIQTETDDHGNS
ncbi:ABC transporter ATP-binding protein [Patescibacteria group bacterium]|nr:ABC transporter ATP-binding protein [Patescibacteria group bacterium]